ncbi:ZP domain-containing protein [Caerostris extrusa]|uniref:ZP domain-containing protein n=1 Tax=Caerostris extrusa TaxID=172846 RepID=A0AAV4PZT8_CAEEX|nr:ZP domain-containing protein [Caerostris extrusa]
MVDFNCNLLIKVSASPSVQNETSTLTSSNRNRKIISVDMACSKNSKMGKFHFKDPFYGSVYVHGFSFQCRTAANGTNSGCGMQRQRYDGQIPFQRPISWIGICSRISFECRASGNGTTEVTLIFSTNKCGTKVTKLPNGKSQYEAVINLQFDNTISGTGAESNVGPKSSLSTKPFREQDFDGWLEILQGKLPSLTPLTKPVHIGENLTMLIKVKHPDGFDSKIINCIATDGSDLNKQLIDSDGVKKGNINEIKGHSTLGASDSLLTLLKLLESLE